MRAIMQPETIGRFEYDHESRKFLFASDEGYIIFNDNWQKNKDKNSSSIIKTNSFEWNMLRILLISSQKFTILFDKEKFSHQGIENFMDFIKFLFMRYREFRSTNPNDINVQFAFKRVNLRWNDTENKWEVASSK